MGEEWELMIGADVDTDKAFLERVVRRCRRRNYSECWIGGHKRAEERVCASLLDGLCNLIPFSFGTTVVAFDGRSLFGWSAWDWDWGWNSEEGRDGEPQDRERSAGTKGSSWSV